MRHIAHTDRRVETGPVQFGDDWPGLFVRGDDCIALALSIRDVLRMVDHGSLLGVQARPLIRLLDVIESSVLLNGVPPAMAKAP